MHWWRRITLLGLLSYVQLLQKITHGSFLSRKPEALAKVAEVVGSVTNQNTSRKSRNFVFTAISPDEKQKPLTPRPHLVPCILWFSVFSFIVILVGTAALWAGCFQVCKDAEFIGDKHTVAFINADTYIHF